MSAPTLEDFVVAGSVRAFFRGNGANVVKIAPETALKLTFNDSMKALIVRDKHNIRPHERMMAGALAGASAQVHRLPLPSSPSHAAPQIFASPPVFSPSPPRFSFSR